MRNRIKNVGVLSALCVVAVTLSVLVGCEPAAKGMLLAAEVDLTSGGDMQAIVLCIESGSYLPVDSATVTVNGQDVPPSFLGNMSFTLTPVAPAANVTMHFSYEDIDILKTLMMPSKPTALTGAGTYAATSAIPIGWTQVSPIPDNIAISVTSGYTNSSDGYTAVIPGNSVSHSIPANTFKTNQPAITVIVEAMNSTTNLGSSVLAGSIYQVANQEELTITTNP